MKTISHDVDSSESPQRVLRLSWLSSAEHGGVRCRSAGNQPCWRQANAHGGCLAGRSGVIMGTRHLKVCAAELGALGRAGQSIRGPRYAYCGLDTMLVATAERHQTPLRRI